MSNNKLSEILDKLIQDSGLNSVDLSKATDIGVSTIQKIRSGTNSNPTIDNLSKIANYFNITISELIGEIDSLSYSKIPIVDWSNLLPLNVMSSDYIFVKGIIHDCFAVYVESVLGKINVEGFVVVDPKKEYKNNDLILVLKDQIKIPAIKRIVIDGFDKYLESLNPAAMNLEVLSDNFLILGVICIYHINIGV